MNKYVATLNPKGKLIIFSIDSSLLDFKFNTNHVSFCQVYDPKDKIHIIYGKYSDLFIHDTFGLSVLSNEAFTAHEIIPYIFKSEKI